MVLIRIDIDQSDGKVSGKGNLRYCKIWLNVEDI